MIEKERPDRQTRFFLLEPTLEGFLANGTEPKIAYAVESFRKYDGKPRVRTNISGMEFIYPYLLSLEGGASQREAREISVEALKASVVGQELHRADVVFNLITQGTVGLMVRRGLPTASQEDLDVYGWATEHVSIGKEANEEGLLVVMLTAWEKLLMARREQEKKRAGTLPMFEQTSLKDPWESSVGMQVLESEELLNHGQDLAKYWVKRYFDEEGREVWGYASDHESVNEVLVILNLELLQIMGRLDRVTRQERVKKTVTVQVTDLKTGRREAKTDLEREIRKRQAQLALMLTERFTTRFVVGRKWLDGGNKGVGAFAVNSSVLNRAAEERARFFYRWWDTERAEMIEEEVTMDEEERSEFEKWMIWYSTKIQENRDQVKSLIKTGR